MQDETLSTKNKHCEHYDLIDAVQFHQRWYLFTPNSVTSQSPAIQNEWFLTSDVCDMYMTSIHRYYYDNNLLCEQLSTGENWSHFGAPKGPEYV